MGYKLFVLSKTFISNTSPVWNWQKNQVKAKQHPKAKLLLFENYSLSSSCYYPELIRDILKNFQKTSVSGCNEIIWSITAQKMKFFIMDFFSKCDQIRSFLWIWSHLLKKYLMKNFIFCAIIMKMRVEMKGRSHRYDMDRTRPRHGYIYIKYKMCLNMMMVMCSKQYVSNIWSWIHENVNPNSAGLFECSLSEGGVNLTTLPPSYFKKNLSIINITLCNS